MALAPCYECLPAIAPAHAVCTPPYIVRQMFEQACGKTDLMKAPDLAGFLRNVQGEEGITDVDAAELIRLTVLRTKSDGAHHRKLRLHSRENSTSEQLDTLDLPRFLKFLMNPELNGSRLPASQMPTHDMTAPLSHYYVFASHNSYLTGNQLTSKSSTVPIVEALRCGCRVIELDCWERHGKIKILHGNTLTKAVAFEDCIRAIKENAFKTSEYPVIITIENHLPPELQKQAASVLKEILGKTLYIPTAEDRPPITFRSPEELKGRIIISDKPPNIRLEEQVVQEPQVVQSIVTHGSGTSSEDMFTKEGFSPEEEKPKHRPVKRAQYKVVQKVAERMATFQRDGPVNKVVPKVSEFQELLYIYCEKPSEMEEAQVKGGPLRAGERAIMANLSESQFKGLIRKHPNSLIEFSKTNLGRVYPFGLRFDSSNQDPMAAWMHGMQVAAINMQGRDRAVWVARAFFGSNGGCGYVMKPDFLLPGSDMDHVNIVALQPKLLLKVRVLLGTDWHRHYDLFKKPDYYVKLGLHGMHDDQVKKQTKVINQNREPHWEDEEFDFHIRVPELAVLRLEAREDDKLSKDDMVGQACIPVSQLRQGIRAVALESMRGEPRRSKLLCYFILQPI